MNSPESSQTRGLVLSDLHLFSVRSAGVDCLESIRSQLEAAEVIVLNGDTFDFRWSTLGTEAFTILAALDWLRELVVRHSQAEIHFIVGNHDCLHAFTHDWMISPPHCRASIGTSMRCVWVGRCSFMAIALIGRWMQRDWKITAESGNTTSHGIVYSGAVI